ncbi:tropinone reductase-like protein [Cucumis melo var. makuwa]|uniref:Tropinone reductase-like protein n=1 Tax=Cucumis melo var. makuwa TaxID=1194695 RepID=A0A5A7TGH8_CUCMM|nr:tropinone reductase-like protein [Cucumis melo var. makuwa]
MMSTNFEAPYHLSQIYHPILKASGYGSIVFVSSIAGVTALSKISIYATTKGAINQITKNLASVVEEYGRLIGQTPAGRIGELEEISLVVAFLCLPTASYISGQIICVDGGFTVSGWGAPEDWGVMLSAFSDALIQNNPCTYKIEEADDEGRFNTNE